MCNDLYIVSHYLPLIKFIHISHQQLTLYIRHDLCNNTVVTYCRRLLQSFYVRHKVIVFHTEDSVPRRILMDDKHEKVDEGPGCSAKTSRTKEPIKVEDEEHSSKIAHSDGSDEPENNESEEEGEEDSFLKSLQKYFFSKLHLTDDDDEPPVLSEPTVSGIVSYIQSEKCKNIVTMAGAGISTSAGIPDFRTPKSGLYSNLAKYDLPSPEAIFSIDFFHKNPKPFFDLAKELYPGSFEPTPCHYFVRLLHNKGLLLRHYTQNIDTLEYVAGIPAEKLVEAHGTFRTSHCLQCRKQYSLEFVKEEIFKENIPTCECSGIIKPDIVFFGENLPERFFQCINADFSKCDLLIIMGTSLVVQPFASLIDMVPNICPRLLINLEKVSFGLFGGFPSSSKRDVAMIGECDAMATELVEKLGWNDEFQKLMSRTKL